MSNFWTTSEIRKQRLDICNDCEHYFSLTGNCRLCGCFMKVKSSIAVMSCPDNKWEAVKELTKIKDIPEDLMKEVRKLWKDIKIGYAKDSETKRKLADLYNTIYGTSYNKNTNCSSCWNTMYKGIKSLI